MQDHNSFHAVDGFIEALFAQEDPALSEAVADMEREELPAIQVSPVQGRLLFVLAKTVRARRILEVGTLGGYSAIWLARALAPGGRLITIEFEPHHAKVARRNLARAGLSDVVDLREGSALTVLPQIAAEKAEPFDMIFIDADKEPYLEYFEWALKLSRPGSLIVADNVVRQGAILDAGHASDPKIGGVLRLSHAVAKDDRVDATILQTVGTKGHDGMLIAVVK